jgi:hypothetical protein
MLAAKWAKGKKVKLAKHAQTPLQTWDEVAWDEVVDPPVEAEDEPDYV